MTGRVAARSNAIWSSSGVGSVAGVCKEEPRATLGDKSRDKQTATQQRMRCWEPSGGQVVACRLLKTDAKN